MDANLPETNPIPSVTTPPAASPAAPVPPAASIPPLTPPPPIDPVVPPPPAPVIKKPFPLKIIFITLAILVLIGGSYFLITKLFKKGGGGVGIISKNTVAKYDVDTDKDGFPDFIETELGLDPNVSEYNRCKKNSCGDAQFGTTAAKKKNVVIILDASGSMGLAIGSQTRMEVAKTAIKSYVGRASNDISLGLLVYGHKGSNADKDKALSCASSEILAPLGSVTPQTIDSYLALIQPTGWTAIGGAINKAAEAFVGKESDENSVIVVSDGIETCDSNPSGAAFSLSSSGVKAKIDVIGFAVDSTAQAQLSQVASSGGGIYSTASSAEELDRQLNEKYENLKKLTEEAKCRSDAYFTFLDCYGNNGATGRVISYLTEKVKAYGRKEIGKGEYEKVIKIQDDLFAQLNRITQEEMNATNNPIEQKQQQILGN